MQRILNGERIEVSNAYLQNGLEEQETNELQGEESISTNTDVATSYRLRTLKGYILTGVYFPAHYKLLKHQYYIHPEATARTIH